MRPHVRSGPVRVTVEASLPSPCTTRSTSALPKPDRHFTDLPPALRTRVHDGVLRVEGVGFVTRAMTEDAFAPFAGGSGLEPRVLIDLRNVSGYEAACVEVAREWLSHAQAYDVERIAFIANSSVVRTATEVVARHLHAPLKTFDTVDAAQAWATEARVCALTSRDAVAPVRPRA